MLQELPKEIAKRQKKKKKKKNQGAVDKCLSQITQQRDRAQSCMAHVKVEDGDAGKEEGCSQTKVMMGPLRSEQTGWGGEVGTWRRERRDK